MSPCERTGTFVPYDYLLEIEPTLAPLPDPTVRPQRSSTAHLAGSRFNELVHPRDVLAQYGWEPAGTTGDTQEHLHWPNSKGTISATIFLEDQHTTVWSETAAADIGLVVRRPYDSFGLWTWHKHGGDFSMAHADLELHGITDLTLALDMATVLGPGDTGLIYQRAADVTAVAVEWLWPGWLPAGKLVTLDGDPATGKSTLTLDIAARLTTGQLWPDGAEAMPPSHVILLSGEDDLDDTIVWRLMAAGADLTRVTHVQGVTKAGVESPFSIPGDLKALEALVSDLDARLVIVDVLNEYLDERVDGHKDQSVRRVLHLMKLMATKTGASVLMLRHLRKEGSAKAIYRGGGSIGIVGAARAGWTVAINPNDEAQRVLASVKANLGAKPEALGFKLLPHPHFPCAQIHWTGTVDLDADELLNPGPKGDPDEASELRQAMHAISSVLADQREVWAKVFMDELRELGISAASIKRARARMNVQSRRIAKPDENGEMGWKVWLPSGDGE